MIEKLRAIFKERTKLIIIVSSVVLLCLIIAIPTGLSIHKRDQIKKQQVLKIKEFNILQAKVKSDKNAEDKRISDKKIADKIASDKIIADKAKAIADKIVSDKIISDEIARLRKAEATRIANKNIADEKLRIAKLNSGISLTKAIAIGNSLYPSYKLKPLSNSTQLINGKEFYVFKLFDLDWNDVGCDWYFCIRKTTGEAFRYYSNNTLMVDDATVTSPNTPDYLSDGRESAVDTGMTLEQAKAIGNNLRGDGIDYHTQLFPVYDYTVVINGGDFYVFEIYNEYAADGKEGVDWRLCISKASGKAFKQLPNKTLHDYQ